MEIPHNMLIKAIELQQQGQIEEAFNVFSNLLSIEPGNAAAL